jgi:formylglycine-generating enzyme required for sulfatase activity
MDRQDLRDFDKNEIIGGYCVRYNPAIAEWEKAREARQQDNEHEPFNSDNGRSDSDDRSSNRDSDYR